MMAGKSIPRRHRALRVFFPSLILAALALAAGGSQPAPLSFEVKGVKFRMLPVPAGSFTMGSPPSELSRGRSEVLHPVSFSRAFYLAEHEMTQELFQAITGTNAAMIKGPRLPVELVSWDEAMECCRKLTRLTGTAFTLPTEAQWEYACRAGTSTPFSFGHDLDSKNANFDGEAPYGLGAAGPSRGQVIPVGSFRPNAWGFYDMHGNVWEWCLDWYGKYPYQAVTDPQGPEAGVLRVYRGGSWLGSGANCRSAVRNSSEPQDKILGVGFRLACPAPTAN